MNYDEAIAELRAEEKRLEEELGHVRAAIPAIIVLRNRHRMAESAETAALGRFAGMGATKAIPELLKGREEALTSKEITEALVADGWTTDAQKPIATVSATLAQLEDKGIVMRVGEAWRIKVSLPRASLNPAAFSSVPEPPSEQW